MTWDEILRSAVSVGALAVSALLGYLLRSREASSAAARERASELRRDGVERAHALLGHLDAIQEHFSMQFRDPASNDPQGEYDVVWEDYTQVARLSRLTPDRELRSLLLAGAESLITAWLITTDDVRKVRRMQSAAVRAMQEAVSCYLTDEPIPFKLHEDARAIEAAHSPTEASKGLDPWRPRPQAAWRKRLSGLGRRLIPGGSR